MLRLEEAHVLGKTVTLPIAAEREIDQVLAFEMDRETPFKPEELFWNHRIARRDRQNRQLLVRLLLVPRANLAALLEALQHSGIVPKRAEIAGGPDAGCYLPLDGNGGRLRGAGRRVLLWPAAACCILLALGAILTPFARQAASLARLDREITSGRLAAAEAEQLRREIDQLSNIAGLVESERDKAGRPLATLAALTRMLPDDTYLTELHQQQRKVTLSGRSAGASRLIGALATGNQLRNPAFAAPVTRIEALKSEVFTITTEVAPSSQICRPAEPAGLWHWLFFVSRWVGCIW